MAKVGLKETLSLLAAGYKKKDIEALAAIDEEKDSNKEAEAPATEQVPEAPAPAPSPDPTEPDYKKMYEDLLAKNQQTEAKVTKLQQANVNTDSAPASEEAQKKQEEDLQNLFRSSM